MTMAINGTDNIIVPFVTLSAWEWGLSLLELIGCASLAFIDLNLDLLFDAKFHT